MLIWLVRLNMIFPMRVMFWNALLRASLLRVLLLELSRSRFFWS